MTKLLVSALLVCCLAGTAFTVGLAATISPPFFIAENREISSADAARLVQRETGGKVLRVRDSGGSYLVKVLLPNGVVKSYSVNKDTGSVN